MIYICFFLCICILCTSVFAPARVYLVSMGYEGFQAKYWLFSINYIYKCFLRAITFYSTARRISLSFRYGRICFYDIFIYCFLFMFFILLGYSLGKFFRGIFLCRSTLFWLKRTVLVLYRRIILCCCDFKDVSQHAFLCFEVSRTADIPSFRQRWPTCQLRQLERSGMPVLFSLGLS